MGLSNCEISGRAGCRTHWLGRSSSLWTFGRVEMTVAVFLFFFSSFFPFPLSYSSFFMYCPNHKSQNGRRKKRGNNKIPTDNLKKKHQHKIFVDFRVTWLNVSQILDPQNSSIRELFEVGKFSTPWLLRLTPDETFHNFGAFESAVRRFRTRKKSSTHGFGGSKSVKGLVG